MFTAAARHQTSFENSLLLTVAPRDAAWGHLLQARARPSCWALVLDPQSNMRYSLCPGCCARFSARSSLYIHSKKHLQDAAPKSRCPASSCDRLFASKHNGKAHVGRQPRRHPGLPRALLLPGPLARREAPPRSGHPLNTSPHPGAAAAASWPLSLSCHLLPLTLLLPWSLRSFPGRMFGFCVASLCSLV